MLTEQESESLNQLFTEMLEHVSDADLRESMGHLLWAGGKRLRPALLIYTYKAFNGDDSLRCMPSAAALELVHTWSLVHDDIMDNGDKRRGIETVNKKYGDDTAILAGDGLMALVTYTITKAGDEPVKGREILNELMRACMTLIEGQTKDMGLSKLPAFSEDAYIDMISRKTGALIETSCVLGGLMADLDTEKLETCRRFGAALGLAFQLKDDLLDLTGTAAFGKEIGKDIREGKKTLIVLHCLANGTVKDVDTLRAALDSPQDASVDEIREILRRNGSIDYVDGKMRAYAREALDHLNKFPDAPYREKLRELTQYIMDREK
mgnify:CR=1 FL=1